MIRKRFQSYPRTLWITLCATYGNARQALD